MTFYKQFVLTTHTIITHDQSSGSVTWLNCFGPFDSSNVLMASPKQKRVHFSLKKKVEVIKFANRNPGKGVRAIAEAIANIGKTK